MLERLLIVVAVLMVGTVAWEAWRLWLARRVRRLAVHDTPTSVKQLIGGERPALLYFTADTCIQCRLRQSLILAQLAAEMGIPVHTLDAVAQTELVNFYGVMTVPTTVLLDQRLQAVAVNHGLASLPRLKQQVGTLSVQGGFP